MRLTASSKWNLSLYKFPSELLLLFTKQNPFALEIFFNGSLKWIKISVLTLPIATAEDKIISLTPCSLH